jgi:hypothetical protein
MNRLLVAFWLFFYWKVNDGRQKGKITEVESVWLSSPEIPAVRPRQFRRLTDCPSLLPSHACPAAQQASLRACFREARSLEI